MMADTPGTSSGHRPTPAATPGDAAAHDTHHDNDMRLNVLVAEDGDDAFIQLQATLASAGFTPNCVRVRNLRELEQALADQSWDVMIANHTLAALDIFAALKIVRERAPDLPFIIAAASVGEDVASAAMRAGANDFIETAINPQRLIPALQRELLAAEARRQRHQARQVAKEAMEAQLNAVTRFRRLTEAIPECVWVLDLREGRMSFVSAAYERIWGRRVQDLLDDRMDWLRHVHPDDQAHMMAAREHARLGGLDEEFRVLRPDGSIRWLHLTTFPIHDSSNHVQSIGGVASDITNFIEQRNELRAALAEQRHRAEVQRFILDALPANIALLDEEGRIIEANASWQKLVDESGLVQYAIGANYVTTCEALARRQRGEKGRDSERFVAELRGILAGGYESVTRIYPAHGAEQQRWYRINIAPLHTQAKRGAVVMHVEITESMLAEQRLLQLSHYDSLTMLPNRLLFRDRLTTALAMARRNRANVAVCFLDLDRFKAINESLGHRIGDQLLLEVASRLKACVRDSDTVSRFGGDEFALILPELADQQDGAVVAERVIQSLGAPFAIEGNELFVTASIGITLFPGDSDDPDVLQRNADTAMYRAKEMGRNNFQFFTAEMNVNAMETMKLERDLRYAIDNEEFLLFYQPKVSCVTGKIVGFEALLRWKHSVRGMVSPAEFVPLLEETGLIVPVGAWVLNTACAQAKAWQDAGLGALSIAVNVSGKQMSQSLCDTVRAALDASGLAPEHLELELTESYLMRDAESIIATLRRLKEMDVTISVDDFGTGYSSLAYLKRFPLDSLKVDRAFVQDITADPGDVSITRAIITLAHSFNLQVVAEGVETEGQLSLLIANNCDIIQGYYFSRPLPVADITRMLQEDRRLAADLLQQDAGEKRTLLTVGAGDSLIAALARPADPVRHRLLVAADAAQGFELLASNRIDVVIASEDAKDMSGLEFLGRVKTLHPEAVRLMHADRISPQERAEAIGSGVVFRFLAEPWDESLQGHIEEAFRHRDMADENRQLQRKVSSAHSELAQLNEQLKKLLATKEEQAQRNEAILDAAQEALQHLPWPIIGIDSDHMIAVANGAADALLAEHAPLLASLANESLPPELWSALQPQPQQPEMPASIVIHGTRYQLRRYGMGSQSRSRGNLVVLIPEGTT